MSQIKILLGNKINDDFALIVGYSYNDNGAEKQLMQCYTNADALIKVIETRLGIASIDLKSDLELEPFIQAYLDAPDKVDFITSNYTHFNKFGDAFFKGVNEIVPHKATISITPSSALLKKIANKDTLYYNVTDKVISNTYR